MASNSIWFQVTPAVVTPNIGWQIRVLAVWDYDAYYTRTLAYVDEYIDLSFTQELNGTGSATLTIDADAPSFSIPVDAGPAGETLLAGEHLWEIYQDGVLRFQFFATNIQENVITEDGTRVTIISGPGAAHMLTWAKVMPPAYPVYKPSQRWTDVFTKQTTQMTVFLTLLKAAQKRKIAQRITPTFTVKTDSAGRPWTDITYPYPRVDVPQPDLGSTLLDLLNVVTGQTTATTYSPLLCEWVMWPNWQLDVRPQVGVDRSDKVIFFEGQVENVARQRNREDLANMVVIRDDKGQWSTARNNYSIGRYGRRETFQQHGAVLEKARRDTLAVNILGQVDTEKSQWTIKVPPWIEGQKPFQNFNVGDWITYSRQPWPGWGNTNIINKFRIRAMSMRVTASGEELELTLESLLEHRQRLLQRQMDIILGNWRRQPATLPPTPTADPEFFTPVIPVGAMAATVNTDQYAVWNPHLLMWEPREFPASGGVKVFIQADDPGDAASEGDFWYDTYGS